MGPPCRLDHTVGTVCSEGEILYTAAPSQWRLLCRRLWACELRSWCSEQSDRRLLILWLVPWSGLSTASPHSQRRGPEVIKWQRMSKLLSSAGDDCGLISTAGCAMIKELLVWISLPPISAVSLDNKGIVLKKKKHQISAVCLPFSTKEGSAYVIHQCGKLWPIQDVLFKNIQQLYQFVRGNLKQDFMEHDLGCNQKQKNKSPQVFR